MTDAQPAALTLDGSSLTLIDLARLARDPAVEVRLAASGMARVERASRLIAHIAETYRAEVERFERRESTEPPVQDYGVTTGFGEFKSIPIAPARLEELQRNLILSHAVGAGANRNPDDLGNYYPPEVVRAVLALRLNTFLKGHSGLRPVMVEAVAAMLNRGLVPLVPLHGSVGSSGDLCPLAHLFLPLVGAGRYAVVRSREQLAWASYTHRVELREAKHLAEDLGFLPPALSFKEGLALINGATFAAALLALAAHDAGVLASSADVALALSLEAACGCARAFDPRVHAARGQRGQADVAANARALLTGSRQLDAAGEVQDPYSLRCAPAVHGASRDAIAYATLVAEREINAATDNPLFFPGEGGSLHDGPPWDLLFEANWPPGYRGDDRASFSAGNFHGQPVAVAADALTIALAELGSISERRTQLLLDRNQNRGLPANLAADGGVQSGLMIPQYCAAGLVSENKVLAHPAAVDSIPTAANVEDHNSMATIAARKLRTVAANVEAVLAIELMTAAQAIDWRVGGERPATKGVVVDPRSSSRDAFRRAASREQRSATAARLGQGTRAAYLAVRRVAEPVIEDRPLDTDIATLRELIASGELVAVVEEAGVALAGVPRLREG